MSFTYFNRAGRNREALSRMAKAKRLEAESAGETPDLTIHRLEQALNSAQAHIACLRTELDLIATSQDLTSARAVARRALGK
jgi:hypothetical protein